MDLAIHHVTLDKIKSRTDAMDLFELVNRGTCAEVLFPPLMHELTRFFRLCSRESIAFDWLDFFFFPTYAFWKFLLSVIHG